ncbi:hypothetical protein POSPLADRAFT_1128684 [Postia placenta MAD-698-R-SB12]|uniref:Small ribosomal subunit protein mS23 n=1 Tax=Postia placenta MAD-698-R-SB12 TaxID=670580 RepID=A0A1X6NFB3_9APHY|nr:hypothetical protein POSPLADRAFT_1128684 [Postia placenta MAD-698-R-SB12]OSX67318.1 hypothetical protein POSPLADRAFT_1128684 [Postia placenta MAD-698-R-SB12]
MSRRIASQVHKQASRLLREGYLKKEPAWFQAVLEHPPLPLPPKAPPARSAFDLPVARISAHSPAPPKNHPAPVLYVEDSIRRQFFRDHPFEAFRATTLLEGPAIKDEHPIRGTEWTRLRQRGRNPSPEDAVRYAANLHIHHKVPLTRAYASAVAQFRALRTEQHLARKFALMEANFYGIKFGPSQVEITFNKEQKALDSWAKSIELHSGENAAKKRWKAIVEKEGPPGTWTRGQEYIRLWQEDVRPTYAPFLAEPTITSSGLEGAIMELPKPNTRRKKSLLPQVEVDARLADFMHIRRLV